MAYKITLNGKPETVQAGSTVAQLLETKGVNPARVAVELNRRIIRREEYDSTCLGDGDIIEVVTFVGGG
ncbi:MAG: sulfur carrier protein ThiS [Chloroflexota bacterium]|jgi:thiamine biosynthesis protein ThiS